MTNDWTVTGQIIRFDMEEDLTCLDLIAIPAGDPFSVVVATARQASLPPGVAALERWSELGSLLQVSLADTRPERCLRICDGTSRIVFDAVMDYPCGRTLPGYPAA